MVRNKVYNHYITTHGYKRRPGNFYWALFFHVVFTAVEILLGGRMGAWIHQIVHCVLT